MYDIHPGNGNGNGDSNGNGNGNGYLIGDVNGNDLDIIAHFGDDYENHNDAVILPVYLTSLHVTPKSELDGPPRKYAYGRASNPTTELLEKKIAALEHADRAIAFSSGMAAITSCLLANLAAGDHAIMVDTAYGQATRFMTDHLSKFGVETTLVPGDDIAQFRDARKPNTKVIYLESPSSFYFNIQDIRAVAAFAKERGIVTMIDNTWATPLYQKPLDLGIDISIHSVSKYIGGHSDIIGGIASSNNAMIDKIFYIRLHYGGILGAMEAWLAIRGLRTMPQRIRDQGRSALILARRLEAHPKVKRVLHPGLESHPQHVLAKSQMSGFTSPFAVELACGIDEAKGFIKRLKYFSYGPSWGGFESLTSWVYGPGAIVRLHVGLEDVESLYADLESSLGQIQI